MKKNNISNHFWTIVKVIVFLLALAYIASILIKNRNNLAEGETVIIPYTKNISDKSVLQTLTNSNHFTNKDGNIALAVLKTPDSPENFVSNYISLFEEASNTNEYYCFDYAIEKDTFPMSEKAREILEKNKDEIEKLMADKQYLELDGKWGLPKNIILAKNTGGLTLSESEFANAFGIKIDKDDLPYKTVSKTPFEVGKGFVFDTTFPQTAYGFVNIVNFTNERNLAMSTEKEGQSVLYTIRKRKKTGNGLSIWEYNQKQFDTMFSVLNNKDTSLFDINIITEDIKLKRGSQSAQGYYSSMEEYMNILKENSEQNNIKYTVHEIPYSKNRVLVETETEFLGVVFDEEKKFYSQFKEKENLASFNNQNYTIGTIYYFIDKDLFTVKQVTEDKGKNCSYLVRNNLLIDNTDNVPDKKKQSAFTENTEESEMKEEVILEE